MRFARFVLVVTALAVSTAVARPLAAETVADCYAKVLDMCDKALAASNWITKPLVGLTCAGMLVGCNLSITVSK